MVRTVCLNEDRHSSVILQNLKQLKHEREFCDFIIKVGDNEYHVHRNILSASSPYFKAMLKHETKETLDRKVKMEGVDAECVKTCIDFMYSGKFDIPDEKICDLLHVAVMMQLEDVKQAICNILSEELSVDTFYPTASIIKMYNLSGLVMRCRTYKEDNFIAISAQSGFENEDKSQLVNIFKLRRLKLSEDDKLTVSLRWAGSGCEKIEDLGDLIECIKLEKVSLKYLSNLIRDHPLISNNFRLYKMLNDPLVDYAKKSSEEKKKLVFFDCDADCLWSYNPITDEVSKFHDENFKYLRPFSIVSTDSCIYLLSRQKAFCLNFKENYSKWYRIPGMISYHGRLPPGVSFSGSLFVIGSFDAPTKSVEVFSPVGSKWRRLRDKPAAVQWHTLVSLDDSIYCVGGWNGSEDLNSLCRFTPSISKWVDLQPMKTARRGCGAVAVEQSIFVMGGWSCNGTSNDLECYDVNSKQWTSLSPMSEGHALYATHINGWIFSVSHANCSNAIEKYDITDDKWSKVESESVAGFKLYSCTGVLF